MTAPNLRNIQSILGKTNQIDIDTTDSILLNNTIDSNKVLKINSILVNGNSINQANVTIKIHDGTTDKIYVSTIVPASAAVEFLVNKPLYLEENKILKIISNNAGLTASVSYEEIM